MLWEVSVQNTTTDHHTRTYVANRNFDVENRTVSCAAALGGGKSVGTVAGMTNAPPDMGGARRWHQLLKIFQTSQRNTTKITRNVTVRSRISIA